MAPTKFGLNPTAFGSRCGLKIFKMAPWRPSWILNRHILAILNLCWPYAAHQVWAQFNLAFGSRCGLRIFKMAPWWLSWILNRHILAILNICRPYATYQVWAQSNLAFWSRCGLKIFKMVTNVAILDIGIQ